MNVYSFGTESSPFARRRATEEQYQYFVIGVSAVFQQWTALRLVVNHCDPNAGNTLYNEVVQWFLRDGEVYSDELELFLEDFFSQERSVILEDDSAKEVGDILQAMYCDCCEGNYAKVELYRSAAGLYQQQNTLERCRNEMVVDAAEEEVGVEGIEGLHDNFDREVPFSIENAGIDPDDNNIVETFQPFSALGTKEEEATQHVQRQQKKKRKNAFQKSSDGWNTVC